MAINLLKDGGLLSHPQPTFHEKYSLDLSA
jgi:hypothetical protein